VVGCGITNENQMFFTKNGNLLGVLESPRFDAYERLFPTIGMDCYCVLSPNLGNEKPFRFDTSDPRVLVRNPHVYIEGQGISFQSLPRPVLQEILEFLTPRSLLNFVQLCKTYHTLSQGPAYFTQPAWNAKVHETWSHVSSNVIITNWEKFYRKRYLAQKGYKPKSPEPHPIENCFQWEFKCPILLEELTRTGDQKIDFCNRCGENVYLVTTPEELAEKVAEKKCVAIDIGGSEISRRVAERKERPRRMMGKVVRR